MTWWAKGLRFVLAHKVAVGGAALGILLFTTSAVAYNQWKDKLQAEAVAAERLHDFRTLVSERDSVAAWARSVHDQARDDAARYARTIDSLTSVVEAARQNVDRASRRAVEAGENLTATLDSIRVVMPVLGRTAQDQWREVQEAEEAEDRFQQEQLRTTQERAQTFRAAARTWQDRFSAEREVRVATERALAEARSALEARTQASEGSWTNHWTVKAVALGAAGYAGYQLGVSR